MTKLIQNPLLMEDGYKTSHVKMYTEGTSLVYSNYTTRNVARMPDQAKKIVVFGIQYTIQYIKDLYDNNFFGQPKEKVIGEAKEFLSQYLSTDFDVTHFEKLYDLGYLPIRVKALPEGTIIGENIPMLTICNTHPDFFWLTNFLETLVSSLIWKTIHSASMAYAYKQILLKNAEETDKENLFGVNFQAHDFSFRGMQHPEAAISSSMGFLTSFWGTDTIPALQSVAYYYGDRNIGFSIPASEHSCMTSYGKENEIDGFKRLIKIFPTGLLSVVSDQYDLWQVVTKFLPELKESILARDGKLIIRPDSGNPVDIICGNAYQVDFKSSDLVIDSEAHKEVYTLMNIHENKDGAKFIVTSDKVYFELTPKGFGYLDCTWNQIEPISENKGLVELLWDIFGGNINDQGFKVLSKFIGCVYGDAITLDRAEQICKRLKEKGFATTNITLGTGSFSMGYCTRDNQGGAVKSTFIEIEKINDLTNEIETIGVNIFKDPVTDRGLKKSAKGLLQVYKDSDGSYKLKNECTWEEEGQGELKLIFENGEFISRTTLTEIREKINKA